MKTFTLKLGFTALTLPVRMVDGRAMVHLKPIAEVFGLAFDSELRRVWTTQLGRRLGIRAGEITCEGMGISHACIRADRIMTYLSTINPDAVRAAGCPGGADFLEVRQRELDDRMNQSVASPACEAFRRTMTKFIDPGLQHTV